MDEKYTLLVIDEEPSFYDDLFFDGWVKKGVKRNEESGNIDVNNASSALEHCNYDAILVEVKWLNSNKNSIIEKLRGAGKPFVVLSRMTETESLRHEPVGVWALRHGASGVIDISSSDKKGELTSIIKQFIPKRADIGYLEYGGNLDDFKLVVNFLLSQPTICFRHYPFYGKTCDDGIFGEGVLGALSEYSAKVLCDALRYAILEAVLDVREPDPELKVIEKRHLWKRLSVDGAIEVDYDRVFLFCVNDALGSQKTIEVIAREYAMNEDELRERLRAIQKKSSKLFSKNSFRHIFEFARINMLFVYHLSSKDKAIKTITHIKGLVHSYELIFHDCEQIMPGKDIEAEIYRIVGKSNVAIVMLCPNLLAQEHQDISIIWINALFQKHEREEINLVPLLLRTVSSYAYGRFAPLAVLPLDRTALFAKSDQPDEELAKVVTDIKTVIDEIWMKPSNANHRLPS